MEKQHNLLIGSHVSMKSPDYLVGSVKEALQYNANCLMIYTGPPQNSNRKPIANLKVGQFQKLLQENNIKLENVIVHAPYLINLANTKKLATYEWSVTFLASEIKRCEAIGISTLVLHPGSAVGSAKELALQQIVKALNVVCHNDQKVKIALETMAGKGSEIGSSFADLAYIIDNVKYKNLIGVCWDTCHLYDAGYDIVNNLDNIIAAFDKKIGLDKLLLLHINDSKFGLYSHKDRHANLGSGTIPFAKMLDIIYHPLLKDKPKILETPWINNKPPYYEEIKMILAKKFTTTWQEEK